MYNLDTSPLADLGIENIFSEACLFIFLMFPLEEQKFLILMKSNLSFFSFCVVSTFWFLPKKKSLFLLRSQWHPHVFSSRNFIALAFTFRSVSHLELIFVYEWSMNQGSVFSLLVSIWFSIICWGNFPIELYCCFSPWSDCTCVSLFMNSFLFYCICLSLCQSVLIM